MIQVDTRAGSKELIEERNGKWYLKNTFTPIEPTLLKSGDIAFTGHGPSGVVPIGIEYKKLNDALNCLCTGRFSGTQLPLLREHYGPWSWLVIEGVWRGNPTTGILEHQWFNPYSHRLQWLESQVGSRRFTGKEFEAWLMTLESCGGVHIRSVADLAAGVSFIETAHSWWTKKEWSEHKSHLAPDHSGEPTRLLRRPSTQAERSRLLVERVASQLEGIGWEKAQHVRKRFKTLFELCLASPNEWREVEGIGKTISERVVVDIYGS